MKDWLTIAHSIVEVSKKPYLSKSDNMPANKHNIINLLAKNIKTTG